MSGQVAQLDPGSYSGGSSPSKIGAQALRGLGGPLMCEKKRRKITGSKFYVVKRGGAGLTRIFNGDRGRYFSLQPQLDLRGLIC